MKKFNLTLFLLLTCILLSACNIDTPLSKEDNKDTNIKNKSENTYDEEQINQIIDTKINELKSEGNYGEYEDQISVVKFYKDDIPQILTINNVNGKSNVRVHKYDQNTEEWNVIYEDNSHDNYDGFEDLLILGVTPLKENSDLEYAIIGLNRGSGGYLSFYVLGQNEGELENVIDRMNTDIYQGKIEIQDNTIIVISDGKVSEKITLN